MSVDKGDQVVVDPAVESPPENEAEAAEAARLAIKAKKAKTKPELQRLNARLLKEAANSEAEVALLEAKIRRMELDQVPPPLSQPSGPQMTPYARRSRSNSPSFVLGSAEPSAARIPHAPHAGEAQEDQSISFTMTAEMAIKFQSFMDQGSAATSGLAQGFQKSNKIGQYARYNVVNYPKFERAEVKDQWIHDTLGALRILGAPPR